MTREEAIKVIEEYDHVRPKSLDLYLEYLDMTEDEFNGCVESMRDPLIWEKDEKGEWQRKFSIVTHDNVTGNIKEMSRLDMVPAEDRTFGHNNRHYYYSDKFEPIPAANDRFITGDDDKEFLML